MIDSLIFRLLIFIVFCIFQSSFHPQTNNLIVLQPIPSPRSSPSYIPMARSMADGSRMMLCMMMLAVLAFNPMSFISKRRMPSFDDSFGEVPGRTILRDIESDEGMEARMASFKVSFLTEQWNWNPPI